MNCALTACAASFSRLISTPLVFEAAAAFTPTAGRSSWSRYSTFGRGAFALPFAMVEESIEFQACWSPGLIIKIKSMVRPSGRVVIGVLLVVASIYELIAWRATPHAVRVLELTSLRETLTTTAMSSPPVAVPPPPSEPPTGPPSEPSPFHVVWRRPEQATFDFATFVDRHAPPPASQSPQRQPMLNTWFPTAAAVFSRPSPFAGSLTTVGPTGWSMEPMPPPRWLRSLAVGRAGSPAS